MPGEASLWRGVSVRTSSHLAHTYIQQVLRSMALRLVSPPPDAAAGGIVQAICSGVTGLMVPVAPAVTVGGTGLLSYGGTELS